MQVVKFLMISKLLSTINGDCIFKFTKRVIIQNLISVFDSVINNSYSFLYVYATEQMFVVRPTPKFICQNLIPSVILLGGRFLGRWLWHEGVVLMNGISAFIRGGPWSLLPHEDTRTKQPMNQEAEPQYQISQHLDLVLPGFQNYKK